MTEWWLGGVVTVLVGSLAVFRAALQRRDEHRSGMGMLVGWHAGVVGLAAVAAAADVERAVAIGVGVAAVGGLALIGLAAMLRRHITRPLLRRGASTASRRLRIAGAWSVPLAVVVATLLELAAALPPVPVVFYVVVLTLVGSWFTESDVVLSVGLRWAVAVAAAAAFAMLLPQLHTSPASFETLATSAAWLGGAVLLVGSTLVSDRGASVEWRLGLPRMR
jgi:hypothetical protein